MYSAKSLTTSLSWYTFSCTMLSCKLSRVERLGIDQFIFNQLIVLECRDLESDGMMRFGRKPNELLKFYFLFSYFYFLVLGA